MAHKEDSSAPNRKLWVGNVGPSITEDLLYREFGQFGQIEEIKVLHNKYCAFVTFFLLEDAVEAKKVLNGKFYGDRNLRVNYVKEQLPPQTNFQPPQPFLQPNLAPNIDVNVIDTLAQWVAQRGKVFEEQVRVKEANNPKFAFLFGGEGYQYYQWKLSSLTSAMPPLIQPTPMGMNRAHFDDLAKPNTIPQNTFSQEQSKIFDDILNAITGSRDRIKDSKDWVLQNLQHSKIMSYLFDQKVQQVTDSNKKLYILYLINDVLHHSFKFRMDPNVLDEFSASIKPYLVSIMKSVYDSSQTNEEKVMKVLSLWKQRQRFEDSTIQRMENLIKGEVSHQPFPIQSPMPANMTPPFGHRPMHPIASSIQGTLVEQPSQSPSLPVTSSTQLDVTKTMQPALPISKPAKPPAQPPAMPFDRVVNYFKNHPNHPPYVPLNPTITTPIHSIHEDTLKEHIRDFYRGKYPEQILPPKHQPEEKVPVVKHSYPPPPPPKSSSPPTRTQTKIPKRSPTPPSSRPKPHSPPSSRFRGRSLSRSRSRSYSRSPSRSPRRRSYSRSPSRSRSRSPSRRSYSRSPPRKSHYRSRSRYSRSRSRSHSRSRSRSPVYKRRNRKSRSRSPISRSRSPGIRSRRLSPSPPRKAPRRFGEHDFREETRTREEIKKSISREGRSDVSKTTRQLGNSSVTSKPPTPTPIPTTSTSTRASFVSEGSSTVGLGAGSSSYAGLGSRTSSERLDPFEAYRLQRSRSYKIRIEERARLGPEATQSKCFNCGKPGHFARECTK